MMRYEKLLLMGLTVVAACSGSRESTTPANQTSVQRSAPDEKRREEALQHFIDGALYDSKEEYARAILEYQEALKKDKNPAIYYAISKDYAALGKHASAAEYARDAIRLDPSNILYREHLADVYIAAYQPELAIREYEKIVEMDSTYQEGWFNLARLYQASKPLRSLEIYERMLKQEGENWEVLLQMAEIYRTLGQYDEAAEKYALMLELDPGNKALRRQLAETYGRAGKFDKALEILESMLEVDENDPEIIATLADLYLDRRDFQKAIELYEKLLQRGKTNQEIKLRVGIAYYGMARSDSTLIPKAKEIFEEITEELPNDWRAYMHLGFLSAMQGRNEEATSYFSRVTALAEWNADAWYFIGTYYFERGEIRQMLEVMERARKSVPTDYRLHSLAGFAYSRLQENDKAIAALERALELNPDDINSLGTLALTYDGMQQYEKSDSLYERALRLDPDSHLILNNYSYSLSERGIQLERALEMAQRAVTAEPKNASYLDTLGWVLYKLQQYREAGKYIGEAIATGGASAVVHEHMGDIHFQLGEKEKAMELWKKALEMNGNNQALKDKVARGSL
ncbi:MAG: tetratricopeptide repeat protein [Ignavibacteriae bacterium]|nr:tetratricopeptide repeat protein [Ignavibacteriota bacterium]